eukprot:g3841.t1
MFWRVGGLSMASNIDRILDKSSFTLEELLEEDDLIQECRSLNGRLISFLGKKHNIQSMLKYMLDNSWMNLSDQNSKLSWQSCEVFCCEADPIFSVLLENEDIMEQLLSILDTAGALDSTPAGYFGRVMNHLLIRKAVALTEYLSTHEESLMKFIRHLEDTSITEILIKLLGADEQTNGLLPGQYKDWLMKTETLEMIIGRLNGQKESHRVQQNAAGIITAIIRSQNSFLVSKLGCSGALDALLEFLCDQTVTKKISIPVINICIAALDPKKQLSDATTTGFLTTVLNGGPGGPGGMSLMTVDSNSEQQISKLMFQKLLDFLPQLVDQLDDQEQETRSQETPYGELSPPLGQTRLKILEMIEIFVNSNEIGNQRLQSVLTGPHGLQKCLDLFRKYPFNNILHKHVVSILSAVLKSSSGDLLSFIFRDLKLLDWIRTLPEFIIIITTESQRRNTVISGASQNGKCQKQDSRNQLRVGYLGHVMTLANQINKAAEFNEQIEILIKQDPLWRDYMTSVLLPMNQRADVKGWKCGRPPDGLIKADDDDEEEDENPTQQEDTDLLISSNGGNNTRYDDDDDEEEEEEEEEEERTGLHWSGVLSDDNGEISGTAAMMSRLALADMTAVTGFTQSTTTTTSSLVAVGHSTSTSSSSLSSSTSSSSSDDDDEEDVGSQSSSSIDSEEESPFLITVCPESEADSVSPQFDDEFNSFNYWRVEFPDVDIPE